MNVCKHPVYNKTMKIFVGKYNKNIVYYFVYTINKFFFNKITENFEWNSCDFFHNDDDFNFVGGWWHTLSIKIKFDFFI